MSKHSGQSVSTIFGVNAPGGKVVVDVVVVVVTPDVATSGTVPPNASLAAAMSSASVDVPHPASSTRVSHLRAPTFSRQGCSLSKPSTYWRGGGGGGGVGVIVGGDDRGSGVGVGVSEGGGSVDDAGGVAAVVVKVAMRRTPSLTHS